MKTKTTNKRRVIILGAGASRSVSYASTRSIPSPLDGDFFDLAQQHSPKDKKGPDALALKRLIRYARELLPSSHWRSMERAFYTLHLRALMARVVGRKKRSLTEEKIVSDFARGLQALLRGAHGRKICQHHSRLFDTLRSDDAVITFNYDLVVERAARGYYEERGLRFGPWIYGLKGSGRMTDKGGPRIFKLHGSSNWMISGKSSLKVRMKKWEDFDDTPGYRGHSGTGTAFPIFLPFWDKRIEKKPWSELWQTAYAQLLGASEVLVWGYSMPPTDVKAMHFFQMALENKRSLKLCVVDPSKETRIRWRELLPDAKFWQFSDIKEFEASPPKWWGQRK